MYEGEFWTLTNEANMYDGDDSTAEHVGTLERGDVVLLVRCIREQTNEWKVLTRAGLVNVFI